MMRLSFTLWSLLNVLTCFSQKTTVRGYVRDLQTGENLIGAAIVSTMTGAGTTTNAHGFFSLTLGEDSTTLVSSYVGYEPMALPLLLSNDTTIIFKLSGQMLDEVVVSGGVEEISNPEKVSTFSIPVARVKTLPFMLGEVDLLKALQLFPGIHSGDEGSTGLYVRGGGPDQNLILLDGAPIYNVSHLFGFFSIFNSDAINHIELIKGGFPARYGGRLSSILDISMKEGSMKRFQGQGSIGLIASKLSLEGPIVKDKASFILSARRTYLDVLARPFLSKTSKGGNVGYYFYDFNLKVNYILSDRDRFYLSTYSGDDKGYSNESTSYGDSGTRVDSKYRYDLGWGNLITALRWNHLFGSNLFGNFSWTFSNYRFAIQQRYSELVAAAGAPPEGSSFGARYSSGIRDLNWKADFDYSPNPNHTVKFGSGVIGHRFSPGVSFYHSSQDGDSTTGSGVKYAVEMANYLEDEWKITRRFKLNAGLHFSAFHVDGVWYRSGQPRISSRYSMGRNYTVLAAFSTMTQYIHLLTNAGVGLPTDLWVPSTAKVKPQQSSQVALGVAKAREGGIQLSVEAYYKTLRNLIEYREGTSFLNTEDDWQDKVATGGTGQNYGVEFLVDKTKGLYTGWLGYTISKSTRQFLDLNFGKRFPYKYDRRHDVSLSVNREFRKRINLSVVWVYGSGNAITLPIAIYEVSDPLAANRPAATSGIYYGDRNSYRLKAYHRMDVSISWKKARKWGERTWSLAVYNAYNRLNPSFVNLKLNQSRTKYELVQYSLFPIIPSVAYSFKF